MSSTDTQTTRQGVLTAAISNAMVSLLHRYTGRGPTRARTTIGENIVVCVMGATLTRGERTLVHNGKTDVVLHTRRAFQETMEAEAIAAVQKLSGRQVVAFMSNNNIDPDLAVEVFILEPEGSETRDGKRLDAAGPDLDGHAALLNGDGALLNGDGARLDGDDARLDGDDARLDGRDGLH